MWKLPRENQNIVNKTLIQTPEITGRERSILNGFHTNRGSRAESPKNYRKKEIETILMCRDEKQTTEGVLGTKTFIIIRFLSTNKMLLGRI